MIVLQSNGPGYNDHTQTDKYKANDAPNVPPENIHKTPRREQHVLCVQALRFISFRFVRGFSYLLQMNMEGSLRCGSTEANVRL